MQEHTAKYVAEVKGSSDRLFGIVFATFFSIIAIYPLIKGSSLRIWSLAIAGVFLGFALFMPAVLAPANRLWTKFGLLLQKVVSPIALGVVFFLTVLPIGMCLRMAGKRPLRLSYEPETQTYWIKRDPPGPTAISLNDQF